MTNKKTNPLISSQPSLNITSSTPLVRTRNDRLRVITRLAEAPEDAITQQQFKLECDMNVIVRNAQKGIPPKYTNQGKAQYGDFSDVPNLSEAYNIIRDAEAAFAELPSQLRLELGNDPSRIKDLTHEQAIRFKLYKPTQEDSSIPPATPLAGGQPASSSGVPAEKTKKTE